VNIVLGASGQVGSAIVDRLLALGEPVKAVVRSGGKVDAVRRKGAKVAVADAFDGPALETAFRTGHTLFVLTPETGHSDDVIGDTKKMLAIVKEAVGTSTIRKIVGLSSVGAEHPVGNLEMSYLLERAFDGMGLRCLFIRPAFYYSNWLRSLAGAKAKGVLPTFYPVDLRIPMASPLDVAAFTAGIMADKAEQPTLFEVQGPTWQSSHEVADTFAELIGRPVVAREMPREEWTAYLAQLGFTEDAAKRFVQMIDVVREGKAVPEDKGAAQVKLETPLRAYLTEKLAKKP
jgi:uncharacterized protein YbjT (DUF2867 family)